MPDTITTFHEFNPATKARSTQVNTNFSNFRGRKLPINEDTASASNNIHDLGSLEHRFREAFLGSIDMLGSTSTTNLQVNPRLDLTSGGLDFLFGNATIASWNANGLNGNLVQDDTIPFGKMVNRAAVIGATILVSEQKTAGSAFFTITSVTISSLTGGPVAISLQTDNTFGAGRVGVAIEAQTAGSDVFAVLRIQRDGVFVADKVFRSDTLLATEEIHWPGFYHLDASPGTVSSVYEILLFNGGAVSPGDIVYVQNVNLHLYEL